MATGDRPRVLVVEDEQDMNSLVVDVLSAFGYEAVSAATGREALDRVASEAPDAVLLDVMLTDMSGFEVCHQLKTSRATRTIPVVFLTALDGPGDVRHGYELGADGYVTKPFVPETLVEQLGECLAARASPGAAPLAPALDLSASTKDLKAFNVLATSLYCQTDLPPEHIEALRSGLAAVSEAARRWAARHRSASPVRLAMSLDGARLRLAFEPACPGAEAFFRETLDADAAVPAQFTDAGVVDRILDEGGRVVFEKTLPLRGPAPPA